MKKLKIAIAAIAFLLGLIWVVTPLPSPLFLGDYSTLILDEEGEYLRIFLNSNEQWCFPPSEEPIPEKLVKAVILYEDKRFFYHPGVDPIAVIRAIIQNAKSSERLSGASTITMQVARISRPKERTILNKLLEMVQAVKLEIRYSKEDILRIYFAHAPYGGNIIGYKAACLRYWGKEPDELTWAEAAALAVLPNSPSLINPVAGQEQFKEKRDNLLKKLLDEGVIDEETFELSLMESVPGGQVPFPVHAPHLARRMENIFPGRMVRTTINRDIQTLAEELAREHAANLQRYGTDNVAVLIAETRTGKVRAYVGSQDFFDDERLGKVDGVIAPRSTGSILKPFLYALAMDEAIILPDSRIKDIPTYYGSFSPYNADMEFRGLVTARSALINSLNVPAVRLLYTYGIYEFYSFLQVAGMTTLFRTPDDYGLPLILGGAEGRIWDLVALYRGLGNSGDFSGLIVLEGDSLEPGNRLISPGACYLVLEILKELKRPGSEYYWHQFSNQWPIAWKTGTSYGHRDALAIGVSPQWTIGVWAGNFSGEGNPNLMGSRSAGTLLFSIFNSLPKNPKLAWFKKPTLDLTEVELCAESGYLAKPECEHKIIRDSPRTVKTLKICPYHRTLFLNDDETYQVCSMCWETGEYREVDRLVYPPEVVQYLKERGQSFRAVPPHNPDCPTLSFDNPIEIIYPVEGSRILVPRDITGEYQKVIAKAAYSVEKSELYWYLDDDFIGATLDRHTMPIALETGRHTVSITDSEGHTKRVNFRAERK